MQKAQVVACFLVPADQHTPEAIHPAMCALHHPPPGFETDLVLERASLHAPCPDMRRAAKLVQQVPHLVVVTGFIQTAEVWSACGPSEN
jgi:hypothetical protein